MSDKLRMLESLVINAEMRNPRYFNANRLVRNMEAMQDHCAGDKTKESTMKTLKSYMEQGRESDAQVANVLTKVLDRLDKLEAAPK